MKKQKIRCPEKFKNLELRPFTLVGQYCSTILQKIRVLRDYVLHVSCVHVF